MITIQDLNTAREIRFAAKKAMLAAQNASIEAESAEKLLHEKVVTENFFQILYKTEHVQQIGSTLHIFKPHTTEWPIGIKSPDRHEFCDRCEELQIDEIIVHWDICPEKLQHESGNFVRSTSLERNHGRGARIKHEVKGKVVEKDRWHWWVRLEPDANTIVVTADF